MSTPTFAADMSFSAASGLSGLVSTPIAVVAADFNNDGSKDLAVLSNNSRFVTILRGNGNGTFQSAGTFDTGLFNPTALTVGDFNHDGKPDLAIISQSSESVTVLINNGTGTLSSPATYATVGFSFKGIAAGDFNGDGWDDLALLDSNDSSISLHLNNHIGSFSVSPNSSASSASSIKSADYNHDGRSDLLVISTSAVSILLGQSNGSFTAGPSVTANFPLSAAMADFDGDGFSDLAIVRSNGTAFVLPGNGDGSFDLQVPVTSGLSPNDIAAADFNNDGKIDLIFTNNQFLGSEFALALNTTTHLWSATYPKAGTATTASIQLLVKLLVSGNVYAVCVPAPFFGTSPTSEQVKNGQDGSGNFLSDNLKGSVTIAANSETSISCSFLSPTTAYDVYVAAEATSPPYLQATPIKISIATAPDQPILDSATSVTARGFTASWSWASSATSYQLDVSTVADFSSFAPNFNNRDVGLTNLFAVTGLSPNTTYYVRVRAVFSGSASTSSNVKSLTTLPVPTAPILSAATGVSADHFTATWGAVANATGYYIDVASDTDFLNLVNIYSNWNTGSSTSYPIYVINPGSTYYYRVRAYNTNGSSNSSVPAAITLPPTAPYAYKVATVSTSGFTASWTSSTGASGYRLDVSSNPEFSTYLPGYSNRDVGNILSFPVSGTTRGVTYYFRVRAYNSGPYNSTSQMITVSVPAVPPVKLYAPRAYLTGSGPSSSVSADFNNDGVLDVAVANRTSNTITILFGTGDGLFTEAASYASGNGPAKIAAADLNNDGNVDLITLNAGTLSIFRGSGNGIFLTALTTPVAAGSSDFVIGDFTGDGILDLAVPSPLGSSFSILAGNGDGTFTQLPATATSYAPNQLVAADFNNDGKLDLAITYRNFSSYAIFLGAGTGTFQPELLKLLTNTGELSYIAAGQLNGDTKIDLVITSVEAPPSGSAAIHTLLGVGNGTFAELPVIAIGKNPSALLLTNLDNDNKLDILTATNSGDQLELLYGIGDGTFSPAITQTPPKNTTSINVSDFNNDGRGDIALTSFSGGLFTVFQQTAVTRTFSGAPTNYFPGAEIPGSLATGDFDKDGKTDLAAGVHNSSLAISFKGDGAGHLTAKTDITLSHTPTGILVTDLNLDGADDIVTNGDSTASISVALNSGNGTFPAPVPYTVYGAQYRTTTGDFNGDGNPDLAVANHYSGLVSILLGNGSGSFGSPNTFNAGNSPHDVISGDFNGDGTLDLVVSNMDPSAPAIYVLIGNGAGTFAAPIPSSDFARTDYVVTGDFNQDGNLDVVVNNYDTSTVSVLLGNGDGSFGAKTDYPAGVAPNDMIQVDLNNDGVPDVVTANGNGYISILFGLGDGTLLPAIHYWTGNSTTVTAGSFTSSGRVDLAVGDALRGGVMLLLNTTQPSFESSSPQVVATTSTTAQVLIKSTIGGTGYAVCLPAGSPVPSTAQIKAGLDATGAIVAAGMNGSTIVAAHVSAIIPLSSLTPGASYDVYVVLEDTQSAMQPVPGFVNFMQPLTVPQLLTVTITGTGSVISSSATTGTPGNINCISGSCNASYPEGSTVTLTATPSWYSTTLWGGDATSSNNSASVVMNSGRNVTTNFVAGQNVQLSNPAGYLGSIKLALAAATNGASIKAKSMHFPDKIIFSRTNTTITLIGGLTLLSDLNPNGFSTIPGPLSITGGKLIIKGGIKVLP